MDSLQTPIQTDLGPTLRANLDAVAQCSPAAARAIARARPHPGVEWTDTEQGPVCLLDGRPLASRRRPREEAERLAEGADPKRAGVFALVGFGCGHHVRAIAQRTKRAARLLLFEPDLALLRTVFERIDCAAWIRAADIRFLTDADDPAAITRALEGAEPLVALGLHVVEHPPSRRRLGAMSAQFGRTLTEVVAALRTVVVTTMVQTEVTYRNTLLNLDHYLVGARDRAGGVADLANLCAGRPAVVVSAGPSLARTIDALAKPGVRDKCVIIAVQTALKPLLARGVRPHFVTALDYHEISRRFYEGLTAQDVAGVTLVAEPKVNPVVPEAFPGPVRCPGDETLDLLLGADLAGEHGTLPAGSTVAHLACYLARHLGCDPVILTGQDLGFTDGQYYGAGAAIHDAWACELNAFTTLEMQEWERIARGKKTLRPMTDQRGRRIYTDEQMATYLAQFERDFARDAERGLRTIDATEGGVAKRNAEPMPLADALDEFATAPLPEIPAPAPRDALAAGVQAAARERLDHVRRDVGRLGALSRRTASMLDDIRACYDADRPDLKKANRLIGEVHRLRDEAHGLEPAFTLVQRLNQTGAFNRSRADRGIALDADLDEHEKQRRRLERDAENVRWLADAAESLARMLDDTRAALDGAPKRTHIDNGPAKADGPKTSGRRRARVGAVLIEDLATTDDALRRVVDRLGACKRVGRTIVLTTDPARAGARLAGAPCEIVESDLRADLRRIERIRRARRFSLGAWRGGVACLTCYDEHLAALPTAVALERLELDCALVVGAEWTDLDPALCNTVIERHEENPEQHRVVFTQAPPGAAPCLIDRALCFDFGAAISAGNVLATVAGALRYIPTTPAPDPIARPICVPIDAALRDRVAPLGGPAHLALELTTRRAHAGGLRAGWMGAEAADIDAMRALDLIGAIAERMPQGAVTLAGRGDPMLHPDLERIARAALDAGLALHIRTDLASGDDAPERLLAVGPDVVSVDLYAADREGYERATGSIDFDTIVRRMERLCRGRDVACGLPQPWVVPRITRCDALLESIEGFYDGWLSALACAAIDPVPEGVDGERLAHLPLPRIARTRLGRATLCVSATGDALDTLDDRCIGASVAPIDDASFDDAWRAVLDTRALGGAS